MPPKRRQTASTKETRTAKKPQRQSKLAKENNISAEEEAEIKEAFRLFSVEHEDFEEEKEGVIKIDDVRRCLMERVFICGAEPVSSLGLPPSNASELNDILSTLDPDSSGYVPYSHFLAVAALKIHSRSAADISAEIEAAYKLFTRGRDGPILLSDLKRVAREMREEGNVAEQVLEDMIQEANGGAGVERGVGIEDFESIMRRAGVFG